MAIWLDDSSKVIVQGITGSEGQKHTRRMVASGTNVVGGVNPRKAGTDVDGIPVFATVGEAMKETGADVSVVSTPARPEPRCRTRTLAATTSSCRCSAASLRR